jgi:hypothetical protein
MQDTPYSEEMDYRTKINLTYECLVRALRLKQRISSLIFAYFLGQLIEKREMSKRTVKQIISEHYYIVAVRTYYIFEVNPVQIYATKETTINMIRKLKQKEFKQLVIEF